MTRSKIAPRKIQKVTLVITAVVIIVALLFILRSYVSEKFGIFASIENEETAMVVDLAKIEINPNLSDNVIRNSEGRIILEDSSRSGWIQTGIENTNAESLTSVAVNSKMPGGCSQTNTKLSVKVCNYSNNQLTCGDWLQSDGVSPSRVQFPIAMKPGFLWARVDLTPCTAVSVAATGTTTTTTTATATATGSPTSQNEIISKAQSYGATDTQFENKNITVKKGGILTLAGKHTFNNLIIENGGIVTHAALAMGDFDENTSVLTQTGQDKKVDLTVTNETRVSGLIDVSAKGFPAYNSTKVPVDCVSKTDTTKCKKGYGPGGGNNYDTHDEVTYAAGAGHGGKGAAGRYNSQVIPLHVLGGIAYDSNVAPILPGSAGGSARVHAKNKSSNGGIGGGVVKLVTGTLTVEGQGGIKANGTAPPCTTFVCGGGGSGGAINIEITQKEAQKTALTANVNAGAVPIIAANTAENGTLNKNGIDVGSGLILQAKGGGEEINNIKSKIAPGAGGRISVTANQLGKLISPELYSIIVYKYATATSTVSPPPVPSIPVSSVSPATTKTATKTGTAVATKTVTATANLAATPTPTIMSAGEFIISGIKSGVSFALTIIIVVLVGSVIIFKIMTAKD